MRILHILDHGLPQHSGYTFRTRAILKSQQRRGWQVAAITGPRNDPREAAQETVDGIDFHRTTPRARDDEPVRRTPRNPRLRQTYRSGCGGVPARYPPRAFTGARCAGGVAKVAKKRKLPLVYEIRAFWEDAAVGNGTGTEGSCALPRDARAGDLGGEAAPTRSR